MELGGAWGKVWCCAWRSVVRVACPYSRGGGVKTRKCILWSVLYEPLLCSHFLSILFSCIFEHCFGNGVSFCGLIYFDDGIYLNLALSQCVLRSSVRVSNCDLCLGCGGFTQRDYVAFEDEVLCNKSRKYVFQNEMNALCEINETCCISISAMYTTQSLNETSIGIFCMTSFFELR